MTPPAFDETDMFQKGLELRRAVLGEAHVERSLKAAQADPFMMAMQQLTTEYGWGAVWGRPGLPLKTRSFLSMAFLASMGKHAEFRTHVRGAVNNGATREEIAEVIIQAALYCGMPVGLECFRLAKEVLDEIDAERH